jgi:DNA (cytosine-5)-methyltransferase 1
MDGQSVADPLSTVCAGAEHHGVVQGAALMTMRDSRSARGRTDANYPLREVTDPLSTQVAACTQDWLLQRSPYLVSYYQNGTASGIAEAVPTVTTLDRHGLAEPGPELRVEDCYFRMLQPHEIQAAMAFPESYQVLGNSRDKVKQLGNAVTPPAMAWLIERCVASLHPEVRR